MNRVPDTFRTVTDSCLFGPKKNPGKGTKKLTGWLADDHEGNVVAITVRLVVVVTEQPQHRPPLPKLDILAVDADEEPQVGV